jgi:hypothetical protein
MYLVLYIHTQVGKEPVASISKLGEYFFYLEGGGCVFSRNVTLGKFCDPIFELSVYCTYINFWVFNSAIERRCQLLILYSVGVR